jgi:putative endonuclease
LECGDERFYYGCTNDLEKRLSADQTGKVRSTKGRRPVVLVYFEDFERRSEAFARERKFKRDNPRRDATERRIRDFKYNLGKDTVAPQSLGETPRFPRGKKVT